MDLCAIANDDTKCADAPPLLNESSFAIKARGFSTAIFLYGFPAQVIKTKVKKTNIGATNSQLFTLKKENLPVSSKRFVESAH